MIATITWKNIHRADVTSVLGGKNFQREQQMVVQVAGEDEREEKGVNLLLQDVRRKYQQQLGAGLSK